MKYATRDLFWLCLVVGISAGWLVDRQRQGLLFEQNQKALVTQMESVKTELETERMKAKDLAINMDWMAAEYQICKSRADDCLEKLIEHGLVTFPSNEPQRHPAD